MERRSIRSLFGSRAVKLPIRVEHPVLLVTFYFVLLGRDYTGLLRLGIAASILHECGHVLVWLGLCRRFPPLCISLRGICLDARGAHLTRRGEFFLAAAGPAVNLGLCLFVFAAMQRQASYRGYLFAAANLLVGAFNLLPVAGLDGKRLLDLLRG